MNLVQTAVFYVEQLTLHLIAQMCVLTVMVVFAPGNNDLFTESNNQVVTVTQT